MGLVNFVGAGLAERFWDILVFVEILKQCYQLGRKMNGLQGVGRTISPSMRTFSPRTRKIPRWMSAYMSAAKIRSMVSCRTRFAVASQGR